MKSIFALTAGAVLLLASAAQAGSAGVEATVRQFGDAFNKGDITAVKALHSAAPTITDEVSPYNWSGPNAFETWLADLGKAEAAEGKTGGQARVGTPTRELVSGDHAYVIAPSTYTFKQKGVTLREVAQMTFVMVKGSQGWKITAWTWTGRAGVPVK